MSKATWVYASFALLGVNRRLLEGFALWVIESPPFAKVLTWQVEGFVL